MFRSYFLLALTLLLVGSKAFGAADDGPPISITSPDAGVTFAYGSIKNRSLIWNQRNQMLTAMVTFTDAQQASGQPNEETLYFRLPGISFDEAKGLFFATSAKGQVIPVARIKKMLFIKSVEATPNAVVRVQRMRSNVTVVLEAISPDDPAMHTDPASTDADGSHKVDIQKIIQ